ncbi:MAG: hypothetical protein CVU05_09010 [Bacteroidetes bacterium HGW-Bacteroidetes-21]|jgi:hypothetical protein|nr:MAG: hypothetical protein CVU05_09010 [Bacteroidetes bacterium HGW-Bacteroidetes-21]
MTLDCENIDTCIASLSEILVIHSHTIIKTLIEIDLEEICSKRDNNDTPDVFLLNYFRETHNAATAFTSSFWFHNTRVKKGADFKEGILPLNLMEIEITKFIDSLAKSIKPKKNKSLKNNSNSCYHFFTKINDKTHWGPYAYLVRQTAINSPSISHDYLKIPEIVEDYIGCKYQNIREQLEEIYFEETISCIVKFEYLNNNEGLLGKALYYIYLTLRGEELDFNSNTCHDGQAEIIKPESICKIEYFLR